jgi:hypothetical protein
MSAPSDGRSEDPRALLLRSLESDRIHSAYLLSGPGDAPRHAALDFVRSLVCQGTGEPCEACSGCRRSQSDEPIAIDGTGRRGPLLRHVGDHPDLLWVERGADDTRVRIAQIRALQSALRLRSGEGGRRAAVVADAEWLNAEAQNALLRLLEEPPTDTTLVLVAASPSSLLATVRSRCQKLAFRPPETDPLADEAGQALAARLDGLPSGSLPDLLDWAEEFRGARAPAAASLGTLLESSVAWLRKRVREGIENGAPTPRPALDAFRVLSGCRKDLMQRNANPQMVAERALLALRESATP